MTATASFSNLAEMLSKHKFMREMHEHEFQNGKKFKVFLARD